MQERASIPKATSRGRSLRFEPRGKRITGAAPGVAVVAGSRCLTYALFPYARPPAVDQRSSPLAPPSRRAAAFSILPPAAAPPRPLLILTRALRPARQHRPCLHDLADLRVVLPPPSGIPVSTAPRPGPLCSLAQPARVRASDPARSPSQRALRLRLTSIAVLPACFISAQPPACFRTPHSSRLNATRIGARSTLQHLWVTAPPRAAPQAGQGIPIALGSIAAHTSCRL